MGYFTVCVYFYTKYIMTKKLTLYHQLLDLAYSLSQSVEKGDVYADKINGQLYEHGAVAEDYFLKQAVVIVSPELFNPLTAAGCKLLIRIMNEMKMNNVFWICDDIDEANTRRTVAELKKHDILMSTEKPGLFIINPFKLRRGKPMASIMASLAHYHQDNTVFKLQDLRPPKQSLISIGK